MAAVRRVAIEVGKGRAVVRARSSGSRSRSPSGVGVVAALVFLVAAPIERLFNSPTAAYRAAAVGLIFVAVAQVYLGGSRGLKIMRHTLYAYWIGQSIGWILLTLIGWAAIGKTVPVTVLAYAASWVLATRSR